MMMALGIGALATMSTTMLLANNDTPRAEPSASAPATVRPATTSPARPPSTINIAPAPALARYPDSLTTLEAPDVSTEQLVPMIPTTANGYEPLLASSYDDTTGGMRGESLIVFDDDTGEWFIVSLQQSDGFNVYGRSGQHTLADGSLVSVDSDGDLTWAFTGNNVWNQSVVGRIEAQTALDVLDELTYTDQGLTIAERSGTSTLRITSAQGGYQPWIRSPAELVVMAPATEADLDDVGVELRITTHAALSDDRRQMWERFLPNYDPDSGARWGPSPWEPEVWNLVWVPMVGQDVFVQGQEPVEFLLEVAATLRPVTPDEWTLLRNADG
jgi:hypothetical protein